MSRIKQAVKAGKYRSFLETRRYAQGVKAAIPVLTVKGRRPGPLAVILACQHGRELNGIAAIESAYRQLDPMGMKGTAVFLPVMNPVGLRMHAQDYPTEQPRYRPTGIAMNMNINRKWRDDVPASDGTYAREIAASVWDAYLKHADLGLDLHGWTGCSLSLAWGLKKDLALLRAFGLPVYIVVNKPAKPTGGMADAAAWAKGIPMLACELAPQNVIHPEAVRFGSRGILNMLAFMGMREGRLELPETQYEFQQHHVEMVMRTPVEGLLVSDCVKGQWVLKGQRVLRILSLETLRTAWEFRAPCDALAFNIGGVRWGEDMPDNYVVYPGQVVGLLKQPGKIIRNAGLGL